jgi:spore coat protein CotH
MRFLGRAWRRSFLVTGAAVLSLAAGVAVTVAAQQADGPLPAPAPRDSRPGFGPGGPPFGPGGMMREQRKLVKQFDRNGDGWLNQEERQPARELIRKEAAGRGPSASRPARRGFGGPNGPGGFGPPGGPGGPGGFGPPGGPGGPGGFWRMNREPAKPGPRVSPAEVKNYPKASLYEPTILRTLFLEFESSDWEAELADFRGTDVEVPATLTVDGKSYPNVGVHFRGTSSYFMVGPGYKRSLNVSLDLADTSQRLYGYKTLNLLNSSGDPSYLSSILYSQIARRYIPAPKANLVKVVINGESWGIYVNVQQFDKKFLKESFSTDKGVRWKAPGSPGGRAGLTYLGEEVAPYQRLFEIKTKDKKEAEQGWKDLIALCRTLNETPIEKLQEALRPILDIDGALAFLALDVALINSDGYWARASDYSLYRDDKGQFHLIPHDMNESFRAAGGPVFGRGRGAVEEGERPRGTGVELDPLVGMDDPNKPLRSRLLAVPALKARYLQLVRRIAAEDLDWKKLGPVVARYRALIEKEVEADTRKLDSLATFQRAVGEGAEPLEAAEAGGRRRGMSLREFAEQRRACLLHQAEVKAGS